MYYSPCTWCLENSCNAGGAHALTHVVVGAQQLCVDRAIAPAVVTAWQLGIATMNSCEAWGEWSSGAREPYPRRVDVTSTEDAHTLARTLGLTTFAVREVRWGIALEWLPANDPFPDSPATDGRKHLGEFVRGVGVSISAE